MLDTLNDFLSEFPNKKVKIVLNKTDYSLFLDYLQLTGKELPPEFEVCCEEG